MSSNPSEPLKITRERLTEVAHVWADFARELAQVKLLPLVEKLPEPVGRLLKSRLPGAPATTAGESVDATPS